jgi:hypothetical protein
MLEGLAPNTRFYPCNLKTIADSLEPADRDILMAAVADEVTWTSYGLHAALKSRGLKLNDKAINKHRKGDCSC